MEEKIKILQSLGSLGIGGNEIFVMNFFRHIDKSQFQVDFVICDATRLNFYNEIIKAGSNIFVCNTGYKNKYMKLFSQIRQIRTILNQNHYDVIHCHSCSFVGLYRGVIAGFLSRKTKVVAHAHSVGKPRGNMADRLMRSLAKWVLSHIIDIGCACSDMAGEGKYTRKFITSKKYRIINNAIETDMYRYNPRKRNEIREALDIKESDFVIGNIGRLEYEKNHTFLLDIFNCMLKKQPNAVLLLVGDGSLRQKLKEKAEREGIASHVIFAGQCESAADYYHAMDCFVLPSHYEGLPFVLVEAQVNGLYCMVSNVVSRMTNASGMVKFLSLDEGVDYWVENIIHIQGKRMPEKNINKVINIYDIEKEADRMEELYRNLLI